MIFLLLGLCSAGIGDATSLNSSTVPLNSNYTATVAQLSVARRDLGGVAAAGSFYFGGGCNDTESQFTCTSPSNLVDVFTPQGQASGIHLLSEARGWPSACVLDDQVVFAGGGAVQDDPHSTAGDVIDTSSGKVTSNPKALSSGRWGIACVADKQKIYFSGGRISGSQQKTLADIDTYSPSTKSWAMDPRKLSLARESMGAAVAFDGDKSTLVFSGGVAVGVGFRSGESNVVDVFDGTARSTVILPSKVYWPGSVTLNGVVYLVGNAKLIALKGSKIEATTSLPSELVGKSSMTDGGSVPSAHVESNGVVVNDGTTEIGCFYSVKPSAVYCYHPGKKTWTHMPCTVMHKGGVIVATDNRIAVAGGFDEATSRPTAVVDFFDVSGSSWE